MLAKFVVNALNAERKASIATIAAIIVHIHAEEKSGRTVTELGASLHDAAPWRSLATWRNYASVANNLRKHAATLARLESDYAAAEQPAAACAPFGRWLADESAKLGYSVDINDLNRFAQGKLSAKAQAQAQTDAENKAAAERAAAALQASQNPPEPETVPQPNDGPATASEGPQPEQQAPATTTAPQQAIRSDVISFWRDGEGFASSISASLTADDLRSMGEFLIAQADAMIVEAIATA